VTRPTISHTLSDLARSRQVDLESRRAATTILQPEAIAGKTSAARLLTTTLGGVVRQISNADLVTFKRSALALGARMRQGVTAQEVIDLSRQADRERSRLQIPTAIATRLTAGDIIFSTSSGPDSKVIRHLVHIVFPGYGSFVSAPLTALQAAAELVKAPLKFDCDCPHHRFRFRFITSALGCASGRVESGFPKLTNPHLSGIGCKHVLRALVELQRGMLPRRLIAKMIEADRARLTLGAKATTRVITATRVDADLASKAPVRQIRTTDDRQRNALAAALRKAMPHAQAGSADLSKIMKQLQGRHDIPSEAITNALKALMQQYPQGASQ
jgi:hypothetical protein